MDPETHNGTPVAAPSSPLADGPAAAPVGEKAASAPLQAVFRERFETLLPALQKQFPEVARHTLEATRGSFDHAVDVISRQTGVTSAGVRRQLGDLLQTTGDQALRPLEEQLEGLLDELNSTLRPKIEKPVRERPLLALGVAAGVGLIVGLLLNSGRRSA